MEDHSEKNIERIRLLAWLHARRYWLLAGMVLLIGFLLFEALAALAKELEYSAIIAAINDTSMTQHVLAILATAISYVALTGYDRSALRYVGTFVPYRVVAQTSFIAFALSNTVGIGVLTGGAVRMRIYSAAGVETGAVSRAIAFNAVAFGLGITVVGACALLWGAPSVASVVHLPALLLQSIAALILGLTTALLWQCHAGRRLKLPGIDVPLPSLGLATQQLVLSALDIIASAAVLWVLLPQAAVSFPVFVGFYAIATVLGVLSHVPGGLGVFEAVMLVALGGQVPPEALAGALVLYRVIYYLLPLALAVALLVAHGVRRGFASPVGQAAASLSPILLAAFTLIVGVRLLVAGVTPATDDAAILTALRVPLPLVEASHFLGSIAGLALLFVARGMLQRLNTAWWAGLMITAASFVLSFPRGISWSEAALLIFLTGTLALSRKHFTRRASLLTQPVTVGWLIAVTAILLALSSLLVFAYRDVIYTHELWWQFEVDGHAPRSLRAWIAVALTTLVLALRQLLRPPAAPLARPDSTELARVDAIVRQQDSADACLALMGDKHIMFSAPGNAFVMFGRHGRSWIGLFDPVGPNDEWSELVWRFLERARESGGRACFYLVRPQTLTVYLDAGLRIFKLGEHASVSLPDFSLKGRERANLRHGVNRAEREGLTFELIPIEGVPAIRPALKAISDAWLAAHDTAEKGFSLGAYDEAYILRQPVALVRKGTQPVAFATLLATERKVEASVDLMRHLPDAPNGTMDFLFAKLMLLLQAQGFQHFSLGMAPLSGMAEHPLAPSWHRIGRLLFTHGEHFYNFQGLRAFKEKFSPQWEARYLASPGGAEPLIVLTDIAALISGGFKGIITK